MENRETSKANVGQPSSVQPEIYPDHTTCRVKKSNSGNFYYCLNERVPFCPHVLRFAGVNFCKHPSAPEIWARSNGQK